LRTCGGSWRLCQLAEAHERGKVQRDSQLKGLRIAIDTVAKKQRHERKKVAGRQEAAERRIGPLGQTALELAEVKNRTHRVESDVAGLRAAMADDSAKVEDVQREVSGLKAQLSDSGSKRRRTSQIWNRNVGRRK
jgi:predicted  nucleic acid-binding Zn-ribbon protein